MSEVHLTLCIEELEQGIAFNRDQLDLRDRSAAD